MSQLRGISGAFENIVDQFNIIHDDVIMRLFSKYLFRDVAEWFKNLRDDSIGSWIELSNTFSKYWGENKLLICTSLIFML
jgi:hypothetical protein